VDVQHPALPGGHQERRQQPHVAGEADDLDARLPQRRVDHRLMRGAVLAEAAVVDDAVATPASAARAMPGRRLVGQHQAIVADSRERGGVQQRGHVGTAAAEQDADATGHAAFMTLPLRGLGREADRRAAERR